MLSNAYVANMMARRRRGCYDTDDTRKEADVCANDMRDGEVAFTLNRALCAFTTLTMSDVEKQTDVWVAHRCAVLSSNIKEVSVGGRTMWTLIVTPRENPTLCPLAAALGILVSGYTYIFNKREDAVRIALGVRRAAERRR